MLKAFYNPKLETKEDRPFGVEVYNEDNDFSPTKFFFFETLEEAISIAKKISNLKTEDFDLVEEVVAYSKINEFNISIKNGERVFLQTSEMGEVFIKEVQGKLKISIEGNLIIIPIGSNCVSLGNLD